MEIFSLLSSLFPYASRLVVFSILLWSLRKIYQRARPKSPINNLPGPKSTSWLTGSLLNVIDPKNIRWHHEAIEKYGRVVKVPGIIDEDQYFVADARALHHIIVKDQHIFQPPDMIIGLGQILFGDGLTAVEGLQHAKQRKIMNPVFSNAHVRTLAPIFYEVSDQLCNVLNKMVSSGKDEVDLLDWMSRTALECVGQAGLGYSYNALDEEHCDDLNNAMNDLIPAMVGIMPLVLIFPFYKKIGPSWLQRLFVNAMPVKAMHRVRDVSDTLDYHSKELINQKREAIAAGDPAVLKNEPGMGKDIISLLMRANMASSEKEKLSNEEILGQVSLLSFAAQDTTSSALCRVIHYLCMWPEQQERLRQEIRAAKVQYGAHIPYDELTALPYLDAITREILRLHPPLASTLRIAREATVLPLMEPIMGTNGKLIHEVPVAKHQGIIVGIAAANRDPAIWGSDAAEWNPERWLEQRAKPDNAAHRLPGVYSGTMTFIGGSRACIGFKFALLELKVVLSTLVDKFVLEMPADKDIEWLMWNIAKPIVKGDKAEKQTFPVKLKVAL